MNTAATDHNHETGFGSVYKRLGDNYIYVLTGLPIAIFSFSLLLSLLVISIATMVVGLGLVVLPLTLLMASAFATLSRNRLRAWGVTIEPARYRPTQPTIAGRLRILADPQRWLDWVFEVLIAFPLRLTAFVFAVVWSAVGLGGVTYFFWSLFVPGERAVIQLIQITTPSLMPRSPAGQYLLDSGVGFVIGLIFVLTLAHVMQMLAEVDAMLTSVLLGANQRPAQAGKENPLLTDYQDTWGSSETSFGPTAWALTGTIFSAVVLLAVAWPVVSAVYSVNAAVVMVWTMLHCAAIVATLRWTWISLAVSLVASGALILVTAPAEVSVWPWPVTVLLTQCAVLIVAGLARPWYYAVSAWSAGVVLTISVLVAEAPELPAGALGNSIVFATVSGAVVVAATLSRMWIRNAGRLEAAERTSAIQDRRSKELAERNRIARELHDVVAHSMSVISVQAATAQYRNPGIDEASQREFDEIAKSSRQALSEMRMLLSILRNDDDAPTTPTPGLDDIDALVEATRASGTEIRYRGFDSTNKDVLDKTAPATGLAAYRIVQEALSNALRHAPGSAVDVELSITVAADNTDRISIAVINGPRPDRTTTPAPGSGLGLDGIRERTVAVGGTYQVGPTPEGGFAVYAHLAL
ncbi:sensor histidine kinase [Enteractinococcus coprophilus]|nr:sensor histidine kinase [Enteractinococcus coprophilus]